MDDASSVKPFRLADGVWVFGDIAAGPLVWAVEQATGLAEKLCGRPIQRSDTLTDGPTIMVGSPHSLDLLRSGPLATMIDDARLGRDDYLLRTILLDGRCVLLVAGANDRAAMYGLFDLFERLGCRFLISRDVVPPTDPSMTVPVFDEVVRCDSDWRGIMMSFCFIMGSVLGGEQYDRLFDQMAKMRLNRMMFYSFENEPFIDYSFQGERKLVGDISEPDSGYISYGRHFLNTWRRDRIAVGAERFPHERIAPPEFQNVRSSDEALDVGRTFIQQRIAEASRRGIGTWISFLPQFVSMNLTKYTRRMPRRHLHWSGWLSCTDPAVDWINRARLENLFTCYDRAEGFMVGIPEGFFEDPYPDSAALIDRQWPRYEPSLELMQRYWADHWPGEELQKANLRADIGFAEIARRTIDIARDLRPDVSLGISAVCKAYLLTSLHNILPPDVMFADIESGSLWGSCALHLFEQMPGRTCVLIPRAVDDGSLAGMQFNIDLYNRDGFLQSGRKHGTAGFLIQTTHVRGNEHNMRFLAEGLWRPDMTPETFWREYTDTLFGPAAGTMAGGFAVLERKEVFMGGRGLKNMPWNHVPPEIELLRRFRDHDDRWFSAPYPEATAESFAERRKTFEKAIEHLVEANDLFAQARAECPQPARSELQYIITRTEGYRLHLETLTHLDTCYIDYAEAMQGSGPADMPALRRAVEQADHAHRSAMDSARRFADCVEHTTDLGVLWMINAATVVGTEVLKAFLANVLAFQEGREYWQAVPWDHLFGHCPFPAHDIAPEKEHVHPGYEPG